MAIVLGAATGACSTATDGRPTNAFAGEREATVVVHNNNWSDITLYAVRSGAKIRLGSVTSMSTASFTLPTPMLAGSGDLQLIADPLGSSHMYLTPPVLVAYGQEIEFTLQNNLALSTLSVW